LFAGIDVGNTTLRLYLCKLFSFSFIDEFVYNVKDFDIKDIVKRIKGIDIVVFSSVVDDVENKLLEVFYSNNIRVYKIDKNVNSIDFSLYSSNIGSDRVTTCLGALSYDFLPFCVIDMGTATTFSVVNYKKEYSGGFIIPGVGTMFKSLHDYTSRLPLVELRDCLDFNLGLSTIDSIRNGVYNLNIEGIKGIMRNIREIYPDIKFFGTGGWSKFFYKIFDINDPYLIIKGMHYFLMKEAKI